jgi:ElaB/YqjD/DUF883 family membrane-anchored ribosome-binding protein
MNASTTKPAVSSIDPAAADGNDRARGDGDQARPANDEQLADLERRLNETADTLRDNARVFGEFASKQIRAHPLAAFGVAFFAGLTAARLLRR